MIGIERYSRILTVATVVATMLLAQAAGFAQVTSPAAPMELFEGIRLGMSRGEVEAQLGKPSEEDKSQAYYERSAQRRIRVYFDANGKATALVASFIGNDTDAPSPESILGTPLHAATDGTVSGVANRATEGYRVSYSRTMGETPMVFVTLQKM